MRFQGVNVNWQARKHGGKEGLPPPQDGWHVQRSTSPQWERVYEALA